MCKFFASLCGLVSDESVKKQIEDLRKALISENEERLLDEKWKRSEQRDQIDQLKSKISELERKQIQVARIVNRQPTTGTAAQQIPIPFRLVQNQQQRAQAQQQQAQNPGFNPQAARQEPALEQQARARLNAKEQTGKKKM